MDQIKPQKRIFKKQLHNVNKKIFEVKLKEFKSIEEKEDKLDSLIFLKNQIINKAKI